MKCRAHGWASPFAIMIGVMLSFASMSASAKNGDVLKIVEGLNTTLLGVMQSADALGYAGRYEKLEPELRSRFDFAFMAKIAVGRAWNDFSEDQRNDLVERFTRMSIATFAARFDGYSGESFEIAGQEPGRRNTIVVDDRLIRPADPPVGLNFVLRESDGKTGEPAWRIIDVRLDGKFSELARQRAEFSAVLERGGYEALIAALDERIEVFAASG